MFLVCVEIIRSVHFFSVHTSVITFLQSLLIPLTFTHDNLYFLKFPNMSFNLQNILLSQGGQEILSFLILSIKVKTEALRHFPGSYDEKIAKLE